MSQQFAVVTLDDGDLFDNLVWGCGPFEWLAVLVPVADVGVDAVNEVGYRGKGATGDGVAGQDAEPVLDHVDPRTAHGSAVKSYIGVLGQPIGHLILGVRG